MAPNQFCRESFWIQLRAIKCVVGEFYFLPSISNSSKLFETLLKDKKFDCLKTSKNLSDFVTNCYMATPGTHTMKTSKTQWFCWIVLYGSALFIQKLLLDILLIANDIAPLIKVFFTDFKSKTGFSSQQSSSSLLKFDLCVQPNNMCFFAS